MKLVLSGEPKSTNHLYRSTCQNGYVSTYLTAEGKAIKEAYQWEAKTQWKGERLRGDVAMTVHFFFATKRRFDLDNTNKLLLDALTGIVYEDDSQICDLRLVRGYDKARPRIELKVEPLL